MQVPILIESIEGGRFRARAGEPFAMSAEGKTTLEAQQKLAGLIADRLKAGAVFLTLEVPLAPPHVLYAGCMKDDPLFEQMQQAIAENRQCEDADLR
jgi:hypothetical protein